jgi:hypothetical protein
MDWQSHTIFGEVLLDRCELPVEYVGWATAPDIDLDKKIFGIPLHRYWRHRFTTLPQIFTEYLTLHPSALTENKTAIALCITSHFYLDIFNGWIFAWNFKPPAIHMPSAVVQEYARDLNANLLDANAEEQQIFFKESQTVFEEVPNLNVTDAFSALLTELSRFTSWGATPEVAAVLIKDFCGLGISFNQSIILSSLTTRYYNFLSSFLSANRPK